MLANGALGYDAAHAKSLVLHYFALLDCEACSDSSDLEPGFILAFDLETRSSQSAQSGKGASAETEPDASAGLFDLFAAHPAQGLTFVLVRTSSEPKQRFWDILCSGPHAYWAWHALLQAGHGKPTFTGFAKLRARKHGEDEVPVPSCLLSATSLKAEAEQAEHLDSDLSPDDLAAVAWLLCGPQAKEARDRLTLAMEANRSNRCCLPFCRRSPQPFNFTGTLACCAEFEACLLARNWHEMPYLLSEALSSGVEAWALCVSALARLARDTAAAAARCGGLLPLLHSRSQDVTLLPEGPQLLRNEDLSSYPLLTGTDVTSAVQVWLAVCRPCALWIMAGAAKRYCPPVPPVLGEASGDICSQVVKALRVAVGTFVSDVVVSDVWEVLKQKSSSGRLLLPRPGGGWLWIEPEKTNWFAVEAVEAEL